MQVKNRLKNSHGKGFFDLLCSHYKLHQTRPFYTTHVTFDNTFYVCCSVLAFPQSIFTCLKPTMKTPEQYVKSAQS